MAHPGKVIAQWMRARDNMTQGELARRSGVSQPTIQRILSGTTRSPTRESLEPIARVFGRTVEDCYDMRSEPAPISEDQEAEEFARLASGLTDKQVQAWRRIGLTDHQISLLRRIVVEFLKAAGRIP